MLERTFIFQKFLSIFPKKQQTMSTVAIEQLPDLSVPTKLSNHIIRFGSITLGMAVGSKYIDKAAFTALVVSGKLVRQGRSDKYVLTKRGKHAFISKFNKDENERKQQTNRARKEARRDKLQTKFKSDTKKLHTYLLTSRKPRTISQCMHHFDNAHKYGAIKSMLGPINVVEFNDGVWTAFSNVSDGGYFDYLGEVNKDRLTMTPKFRGLIGGTNSSSSPRSDFEEDEEEEKQ